jgi:hypothetical protein
MRLFFYGVVGLLCFFPLYWLLTSLIGERDAAAWTALPVAFVAVPALLWKLWPKPSPSSLEGRGLHPEGDFEVAVDDTQLTVRRPEGVAERMAIADLRQIVIVTEAAGQSIEAGGAAFWWWWVGSAPNQRLAFPHGANGERAVQAWAQLLPGFEHGALAQAMRGAAALRLVCWTRPGWAEEGM